MTIIAWDGKTLAADKMGDMGGVRVPVTKIRRIRGHLVGVAGRFAPGVELMAWFERGADPKDVPAFQRDNDDFVSMLAITPAGGILKFEQSPHPIEIEAAPFAIGSGRDFALAAMHLGHDARRAVEVAIALDIGCGVGVDTLQLVPEKPAEPVKPATCDLCGAREDKLGAVVESSRVDGITWYCDACQSWLCHLPPETNEHNAIRQRKAEMQQQRTKA